MYNPKSGELIFIDEDYTLSERPSLNKEQLKEWIDMVISNPKYYKPLEEHNLASSRTLPQHFIYTDKNTSSILP